MFDASYHYWGVPPARKPTKFDIVGGFPPNENLAKYIERVGGQDIELDDILVEQNSALVIGSGKTLSHDIDPALAKLFKSVDEPQSRGRKGRRGGDEILDSCPRGPAEDSDAGEDGGHSSHSSHSDHSDHSDHSSHSSDQEGAGSDQEETNIMEFVVRPH